MARCETDHAEPPGRRCIAPLNQGCREPTWRQVSGFSGDAWVAGQAVAELHALSRSRLTDFKPRLAISAWVYPSCFITRSISRAFVNLPDRACSKARSIAEIISRLPETDLKAVYLAKAEPFVGSKTSAAGPLRVKSTLQRIRLRSRHHVDLDRPAMPNV